ncbi:transcriptional repressor [Pseudaestuariivita sp.]|uniref:transcriptional repressor n=1 Tax=Pseudaestuariivita sp. TaxID=2211669 RepID=UPI0040581D54
MDPIGFSQHDHTRCIATGLAEAEAQCAARGVQLTATRRRVLEILLTEHRALGAYEILDILRQGGQRAQPPVAYRALDFLVTHGFAHRIEGLNAFVACTSPGEAHAPAFLICTKCDNVAETAADPRGSALGRTAASAGFEIETTVLEAKGVCPKCR